VLPVDVKVVNFWHRAFLSISSCYVTENLRHNSLDLKCLLGNTKKFVLTDHVASRPLKVRLAVLNEPNPIPGLTNRLMNRWFVPQILRYLTGRSSAVLGRVGRLLSLSIVGQSPHSYPHL